MPSLDDYITWDYLYKKAPSPYKTPDSIACDDESTQSSRDFEIKVHGLVGLQNSAQEKYECTVFDLTELPSDSSEDSEDEIYRVWERPPPLDPRVRFDKWFGVPDLSRLSCTVCPYKGHQANECPFHPVRVRVALNEAIAFYTKATYEQDRRLTLNRETFEKQEKETPVVFAVVEHAAEQSAHLVADPRKRRPTPYPEEARRRPTKKPRQYFDATYIEEEGDSA